MKLKMAECITKGDAVSIGDKYLYAYGYENLSKGKLPDGIAARSIEEDEEVNIIKGENTIDIIGVFHVCFVPYVQQILSC